MSELGGGLVAIDRVPRQRGVEYLLKSPGKVQIGPHLEQLRRLVGEALDHRFLHGIGGEGERPREHVEEHQAQRVDVCPAIQLVARELLRAHELGVPTTRPVLVTFWPPPSPPTALARPKSTTFTASAPSRLRVSMMLSGFRSRCTMPRSCAACRAAATWMQMSAARTTGSAPSRLISSVSGSPSMNSIAR